MQLYGLIGRKLGHSFSANFFNEKFNKENIDAEYKLFEIPSVEGISKIIADNPNLKGLNVTIPYKQEILSYVNELSKEAEEIGAVNAIKIDRDSNGDIKLIGHNTDAPGFKQALLSVFKDSVKKALVLGQGGASKAVIYALISMNIEVTKVSRKKSKETIEYSGIDGKILDTHQLIVNCTPLGMFPNIDECPDIPYHLLTPNHICFDLVYNPAITEFMRRSATQGATVKNGLEMLYNQALYAWDFWNK